MKNFLNNQMYQLTQEEINEQQLNNRVFFICINPSTNSFFLN
jgi:hypothetical protein